MCGFEVHCDEYAYCIPHLVCNPKYTKVKVSSTQDKHNVSFAASQSYTAAAASQPEYVATHSHQTDDLATLIKNSTIVAAGSLFFPIQQCRSATLCSKLDFIPKAFFCSHVSLYFDRNLPKSIFSGGSWLIRTWRIQIPRFFEVQ